MSLGPRPTSLPSGILIHPAIWPQQIWAENWGGAVPLWGRRAESPCNTMWPGPRPSCLPSFILIHPIVWPQYTNVTDRTDRQTDRQYRQDRQWSDSIRRTMLQTVAQKLRNLRHSLSYTGILSDITAGRQQITLDSRVYLAAATLKRHCAAPYAMQYINHLTAYYRDPTSHIQRNYCNIGLL